VTDPTPRAVAECEDSVPARPHGLARLGSHDQAGSGEPEGMRQFLGPANPAAPHRAARLTVLSGPSAVGKSTVVEAIRRHNPEVWLSISVTTRRPRPGEVHGREYYFVTEEEFKEMAAAGELLEWARYTGNFYGTLRVPVAERVEAGIPSLLEVDVVGARQVRAAVPGALLVFLAPPSWDELVRRLTGRGTESADVIGQRLEAAKVELQAENEFDVTLVNTSVKDVCAQLVALMMAVPVR
jgi:guanylate kinase